MTLNEYLNEHKGELVKVGTILGTNFIYCGRIDKTTIKWFKAMNEAYFQRYMIEKKAFTERGAIIRANMPRWTGILNREVMETYVASDIVEPEETTIVMIFGFERGCFWTIEEWDTKVSKYKLEEYEDEEY